MTNTHRPGSPKRVLIVDDLALTRFALRHWIGKDSQLEVCGEAETARACLVQVERMEPDLVLLDLNLPDKSGLEVLRDIKAFWPDIPVLIFSVSDENLYAGRALQAGARGYLMKKGRCEGLLDAIHAVLAGKIHVSDAVSRKIVESFSGRHQSPSAAENLTDRELEVFKWIGEGLPMKKIAQLLGVSSKTVEAHRNNAKRKLGAENSSDLIRMSVHWFGTSMAGESTEHRDIRTRKGA